MDISFYLLFFGLLFCACLFAITLLNRKSLGANLLRGCLLTPVLFLVILSLGWFVQWWVAPVEVSPNDLPGNYVIDTSMYPGRNARWQYQQYRFSITEDERVILLAKVPSGWRKYQGRVQIQPTAKSVFIQFVFDGNAPQLLALPPKILRTKDGYHLVVMSRYGNMFFVKDE